MNNPIVLDDETAYVFVHHKGRLIATAIDRQDLPVLSGMNVNWSICDTGGRPYVRANVPDAEAGAGYRTVYLHRLLAGAQRGSKVMHLNGHTLDNRRVNLSQFQACAPRSVAA